jgi:hypothetical protein
MEINRNQIFLVGTVLLFLGIEFRMTDSFVLNAKVARLLADQPNRPVAAAKLGVMVRIKPPAPPRVILVPEGLGWLCLSVGSVFVLQGLTKAKPAK